MSYSVLVDSRAIHDIQEAIDQYETQKSGLGVRFENTVNKHMLILEKNPFFQIRYDNVRCLLIKKFPFMIHFILDEANNLVIVKALLHTSRNLKWIVRK